MGRIYFYLDKNPVFTNLAYQLYNHVFLVSQTYMHEALFKNTVVFVYVALSMVYDIYKLFKCFIAQDTSQHTANQLCLHLQNCQSWLLLSPSARKTHFN